MASGDLYEYLNENAIHEDLICPICTDPLVEPLCADECGHTFCRQCITNTFREMSQCPTCRHPLTIEDFRPVTTRPFLNQLNQLLVKCKCCSQTDIQRGNFKEHSAKCEQRVVSCPAADIKCDWTGQRDKMQEHVNECVLMKVQPMIAQLNAQVKQQAEQIRFLYTILEKKSESQKKACKEPYLARTASCDICEEIFAFNKNEGRLHYCPNTDFCSTCVKKHFS